VDVYHHFVDQTSGLRVRLDEVFVTLGGKLDAIFSQLQSKGDAIMADLSALQTEVEQNGEVAASAVALLNGLAQQLRDAAASNDPAAIQALADQLDANTQNLADAVSANTPGSTTGGVSPGPGETPEGDAGNPPPQ
jgi:hypothetical protein